MAWLKWHIGSSQDPKFRVIAKHAKVKVSDVLAVWLLVLEYAFEHDGSIEGLNREIIEADLNMRLEKVDAIFAGMYELSLLTGELVTKWDERQAVSESHAKKDRKALSNAERQRRHRDKIAGENNDRNENVTERNEKSNGDVTDVTPDIVTCNESVTKRSVTCNEEVTGISLHNVTSNADVTASNESVTKSNAPLKEKIKIKNKEKDIKNSFCPELSGDSAAQESEIQPALIQPFILLPLNDKSEFSVLPEQVDKWQELYPAVNVPQQLRNMRGWLDANPGNRKTKSGINRFVNNWLTREQNKAGTARASPPRHESLTWAEKEDRAYRLAMQEALARDQLREGREAV